MSNASTGSAGQTPPPVRFPDTGGQTPHRWSARTIALVVGAVVLVAAVVVAAIVFTGGSTKPQPVPTVPSQLLTPAPETATPQSNTRGSRFGVQPVDFRSTLEKPAAPVLAVGPAAVDIGDGLSLVPAKGWTVENSGSNYAILMNRDSTAELFVSAGKVKGSDVMAVLEADINTLVNGPNAILTNVKVGDPDQQPVQSKNFQTEAAVAYSAEVSTQQGTMPIWGVFVELMNPKTHEAVFLDLHAVSQDALEPAAADADAMITSLL